MSFDWFKRDTGAWLTIEQQLSLEQAGALNVLADVIHKLNAPLADDDRRVAGLLGCHVNKWRPIKQRLIEVGAVKIDGERLDIPAMTEARQDQHTTETRRRLAGHRGGIASARMRNVNDLAEAKSKQRRGGEINNPLPLSGARGVDEDFTAWWSECPRKEDNIAARKAYKAARKLASREQLLTGIRDYAVSVEGRERRYIKLPATWLNKGAWANEVEPVFLNERNQDDFLLRQDAEEREWHEAQRAKEEAEAQRAKEAN